MNREIAGKIYDRFCKEKDKLNKDNEIDKLLHIITNSNNAPHDIYVRYGVDLVCKLNYNDHINEIKLILNS